MRFRSLLIISLVFILWPAVPNASAASRIEFVLDVSGSMNATTRTGEKRIDAARKAVANAVQGIPDGQIVGLRLYSHRVPSAEKERSCKDTELVVPFGPINKQQIVSIVNNATPLGQTPIAYSLEQAAADFPTGTDEQPVIILVSDGEESCGGDPVAVAKGLVAKGFKVTIHTIGLDVSGAAVTQLQGIASATGGTYKDAKDVAGLTSSLQELTQQSLVIQKAGASVYGEEIRGGDNYETAVPLSLGKLYRLNHHQRQNQYDYFFIEAKPGQKIVVSLETGEKGVNIKPDNTYEENLTPYAGIGLHNPQKTKLRHEEIIGGKNDARQIIFPVPPDGQGRYYLLVGSAYDHQHKDHRFKVEITSQFDAGSQQDAGASRDTGLSVQGGTIKGFLNPNDEVDTYKVQLSAGPLNVRVRPSSEKARLRLQVFDAEGVEVADNSAPNDGAVAKIENASLTKGGEYILKVASIYSASPETEYTVEITGVGAAPTAGSDAIPPGTPAAPGTPPVAATPAAPTPGGGPPPAAPVAAPPSTSSTTTVATTSAVNVPVTAAGKLDIRSAFNQLTFMQKVMWLLFCVFLPAFGVFLFGWLVGYVMGRRSGRRKALAQVARQAPPVSAPPPPPQKPIL